MSFIGSVFPWGWGMGKKGLLAPSFSLQEMDRLMINDMFSGRGILFWILGRDS
jgi:hypothetical protein